MPKRQRRIFTSEFKKQMVQLYENRKSRAAIVEEYGLTASALDRWINQAQTTGSFKEKENRSLEETELMALRTLEDGGRYSKASGADHGTKVAIIRNNLDKYLVSALCNVLQIARSTYYYEAKERPNEDVSTRLIVDIFHKNR
ncbi:helix-turn-helix domain-containing protein [Paenibacillus vini]|uniref:helix-turn-helix domain-containing protein n=1 Tax=Paenibacillus vini TaxID=1476024 RepID=UPI0025B6F268|nr:helix-turn-helix domain-containing protein [Paenibacillus vini]MDN4066644.1 helix-turn-helix domain-containing protein [Paenibacillus vini]